MRRAIKFMHTLGAIGLMGAMACLLVLLDALPAPDRLADHAALRGAMGTIATWIALPSLALVLVAGLLAMAANRAFQNAGWAWVKLATGLLVFEGGFSGVVGPMQEAALRSAQALQAGTLPPAAMAEWTEAAAAERNVLWVLMAVAMVNVALGIWRPRLMRQAGSKA